MAEDEIPHRPVKPEEAEEGDGPLRQFLGLFVVPLLVVVLCVGIFIGFGWIAYDRQTTADYLNDLRSGWGNRRRQAAYELSKILMADPQALAREPGATAEVRRLFQETDDPMVRQYLALVLGYTRDQEAVPLLVKALDDPEPRTPIYSMWALGTIGGSAARESLLRALQSPDPGIRKMAAYALGEVGDPEAIPALVPLLEDPVADVRWNAALSLARLGSAAGVPVLLEMLDRRLIAQVPEITPRQQEEAMINAIEALATLGSPEVLPVLERLAEDDPSLKVRQAALKARKALASL